MAPPNPWIQLPHPPEPMSRGGKLRSPRTSTSASPGSSSSRSPMLWPQRASGKGGFS